VSRIPDGDRIVGCIIGGAIGDAMGTAYEGMRGPVALDDRLPWRLSDDTQLTLATCEAIARDGRVDPEAIAERFAVWFREGRITGIGASTYKALSDLVAGVPWALAGHRGEYAAGNGAAMRIAPVALALDVLEPSSRELFRDVCRITHHNDEAYVGALAIAVAISKAASSAWSAGDDLLSSVAESLPDTAVRDRIVTLASLEKDVGLQNVADRFGAGGYVVESVPLALFIVERCADRGFEQAIKACISVGGDTDTIASMAGHVLGAQLGLFQLPSCLTDTIPDRPKVLETADRFAAALA
jgi:ADP-ribosylglycohydrolase